MYESSGAARLLAGTAVAALLLGALTSSAQGWLPVPVASLANSAAPWSAIAMLLALPARRAVLAALCACLALAFLVVGYYSTSALRGFAVGTRTIAFWLAAALLVGPWLGLAAHLLRRGRGLWAGAACGLSAGLLIGEGTYGLTVIADSTNVGYWWAEVACGVALLVVLSVLRLRTLRAIAVAVLTAGLSASALVGLLAGDLLRFL